VLPKSKPWSAWSQITGKEDCGTPGRLVWWKIETSLALRNKFLHVGTAYVSRAESALIWSAAAEGLRCFMRSPGDAALASPRSGRTISNRNSEQ